MDDPQADPKVTPQADLEVEPKSDPKAAHAHNHAQKMDAMYRFTRHVYDFSRRFYLLGRDRLIRDMTIRPGDHVIEIGCGTARNLIRLARRYPQAHFYGLDASQAMLDTAAKHIKRKGLSDRITLRQGLAEGLDHKTFDLGKPFDVVFFSYSLSMIPTWPDALEAAIANLAPTRSLYAVDFWDQALLPAWFRKLLTKWLDLFHVKHEPALLEHLQGFEAAGVGSLSLNSIARRYAFVAELKR